MSIENNNPYQKMGTVNKLKVEKPLVINTNLKDFSQVMKMVDEAMGNLQSLLQESRKYWRHTKDCDFRVDESDCTCGLTDFVQRWEEMK